MVRLPAQPSSQRDEDCRYCRGFPCNLRVGGENVLPKLLTALCYERTGHGVCGIEPKLIAQPDAVPLKYFRMQSGQSIHESGRAHALKRYVIGQTKSFSKDRLFIRRPCARGACLGMNALSSQSLLLCWGMPHPSPARQTSVVLGGTDDIAQETLVRL
ncbi:MAG: hypothetical protein CPDRYMAC_7104, partial [uncultured Paraburkholderia sp.]